MSETNKNSSAESIVDIRIVGLNTEKTRKAYGSDTIYEVYFDLSGTPSLAWRDIYKREGVIINPTQEINIERGFLIMQCPLQEVAIHLPFLKKTVDATNKKYRQYVQEQVTEQEHKVDEWERERKAVEDIAKSLHFD
jgi:hypothetical protein